MNRIVSTFDSLRAQKRKALMPFICAGDPGLPETEAILRGLDGAGASVIEVGIPFSDPVADGPVIQAAMHRALTKGVKVAQILESVSRVRPQVKAGLVAMVSYSIVHRLGLDAFLKDAAQAGFDGMIFPDLTLEEAGASIEACARHGVTLSLLIAPTTPIERAEKIARASTGFVYVMSRAGITGVRSELPPELHGRINSLRQVTNLPLAVGFGVSDAAQVKSVVSVADAAIVGSALCKRIHDAAVAGQDAAVAAAQFTGELARGLDS